MILKNLRLFHNFIKKLFLDKYTNLYTNSLLDLATGKGGDLFKWKHNQYLKNIYGVDFNSISINIAKKRLNNLKINDKKITFKVLDLSKNILQCNKSDYSIITCNFAFHYFFKNFKTLQTILKSINNCSKKGTVLILTLFDGSRLKNINSNNFYIKINKKSEGNYGNEVEVFIKNSVLNKPEIEYIVYPEFLIKKLQSINFNLIECNSFEYIHTLFPNIKLNNEEKMLSYLNNVYIFQKN